MKIVKPLLLFFFGLAAIILVTIGIYIIITITQDILFVPEDYLFWLFKFPLSSLVLIFEIYLIVLVFYLMNIRFRIVNTSSSFLKKHRRVTYPIFAIVNILLIYAILFNVTIIQKDRIIDYTFFNPQGETYSYEDVIKINTGVHGKNFPLKHSKGDFYYIIEFSDGKKLDLTEVGGVNGDVHEYFILNELDQQFVQMGIPKTSSMENFEHTGEYLDKIYTDQIREILENTNED